MAVSSCSFFLLADSLITSRTPLMVCMALSEAERCGSGAADSGSEGRADAGSRRLQPVVGRSGPALLRTLAPQLPFGVLWGHAARNKLSKALNLPLIAYRPFQCFLWRNVFFIFASVDELEYL